MAFALVVFGAYDSYPFLLYSSMLAFLQVSDTGFCPVQSILPGYFDKKKRKRKKKLDLFLPKVSFIDTTDLTIFCLKFGNVS